MDKETKFEVRFGGWRVQVWTDTYFEAVFFDFSDMYIVITKNNKMFDIMVNWNIPDGIIDSIDSYNEVIRYVITEWSGHAKPN